MKDAPEFSRPEFSRMVDIREISDQPLVLTATPEECVGLARRFGILAVDRLEARVELEARGRIVTATGRFAAQIVQSCAVSAEDLPVTIAEPLLLRFIPARNPPPETELELAAEDCDEIDYSGTAFDLGEAVAQSLALVIDPFATGPMAEQTRRNAGLLDEAAAGPFAALKGLTK